jgi:LacI family gluconate utilization system Gnt-I transcriptional repressor
MLRKPRSSRATLSDVAALAAVSAVTASRALRNPEVVSPRLRARVEAAARRLAYVPNQFASALASSRTGRIGVVVPSLTNGVFSEYLRALHDVFLPAGFQVVVLNSNYLPGREEKAIAAMLGQFPEAVILAGIGQTRHARRLLRQAEVPIVQTMEIADAPIDINIGLSHIEAGYAAARHLFELGHRRVAHLMAPRDSRALKRAEGYGRAAQEYGVEPLIVAVDEPSSVTVGARLLTETIAREPRTTAVFCGNDNLALGALFECQRRGVAVPRDMSIMGYNDLEFAAQAYPSLSTIATPRYEIARRAADIVLEVLRGAGERPTERRIDLGFRVVVRESTGAPRASA